MAHSFIAMDELENIRKRAKRLVREHRSRSYLLPERLRRALPRYRELTDREILDRPFALHDAQELLATELGFASWPDLRKANPMTPTSAARADGADLLRVLPQLFVRDVGRSVTWYRDKLGFQLVFTYGRPPFYAEVRRGGAALNLRHTDGTPWNEQMRDTEELLAACIAVSDAKALYLELRARDVDMAQPLGSPAYGGRQFVVRDPDRNLILFGSGDGTERSDAIVSRESSDAG